MKVSIIILNWNRAKDTIACLQSISKLSVANYQLSIVVVDNASTDNSLRQIEKTLKKLSKTKGISSEVIKNKENLGFAAGNNVGITHALEHKSDFVLLLNNDTTVDEKLLVNLLRVAEKHQKAALISPKIYFAKGFEFHKDRYKKSELGKVIWYAGGEVDWDNVYGTNRGVDELDRGQYDKVEETDFATGACVLIRAMALKEVGVFDEKYFMYFEDVDLSTRMKKSGWKVLYSPQGHLWHKVAQSSKIGSKLNDYFITRNRLLFGMGYAPIRSRFALYKESLMLLLSGREWQKKGIMDFFFLRLGRGSWRD